MFDKKSSQQKHVCNHTIPNQGVVAVVVIMITMMRRQSAELVDYSQGTTNALCMVSCDTLAGASNDAKIRLWHVPSGRVVRILKGHMGPVTCLRMASVPERACDRETDRETDRGTGRETDRGSAAPTRRLASGSSDGTIRIWNVSAFQTDGDDGSKKQSRTGADAEVELETADRDKAENENSDAPLAVVLNPYPSDRGRVASICMVSARILASADTVGDVYLWDIDVGRRLMCMKGHFKKVTGLCMISAHVLASASLDGMITLWDVSDACQRDDVGSSGSRYQHPDCRRRFALHSYEGGVRSVCLVSPAGIDAGIDAGTDAGTDIDIGASLAKGALLAGGSTNGNIEIWNVASQETCLTLRGHSSAVTALCMMSETELASASEDSTVRIWNVPSGRMRMVCKSDDGKSSVPLTSGCMASPALFVGGMLSGRIVMWNLSTSLGRTGNEFVDPVVRPGVRARVATMGEVSWKIVRTTSALLANGEAGRRNLLQMSAYAANIIGVLVCEEGR